MSTRTLSTENEQPLIAGEPGFETILSLAGDGSAVAEFGNGGGRDCDCYDCDYNCEECDNCDCDMS